MDSNLIGMLKQFLDLCIRRLDSDDLVAIMLAVGALSFLRSLFLPTIRIRH